MTANPVVCLFSPNDPSRDLSSRAVRNSPRPIAPRNRPSPSPKQSLIADPLLIYRKKTSDFRVEEIPLFDPSGRGPFLYLKVRKENRESLEIARALAEVAQCAPGEVGMAGRKDRRAITEQWFSVAWPEGKVPPVLDLNGVEVLQASRHEQRLRTGQLQGNRFVIKVRGVPASEVVALSDRARLLEAKGFANRFGPQRFGNEADNPEKGREILEGTRSAKDRRAARFLVSALQSSVFNATLALRREEIGIATLVDGDLALVHVSGGLFWIDSGEAEQARADALELSPTGPLFGDKMRKPFAKAGRWEQQALADAGLREDLFRSRRGLRIHGARRALRAPAKGLQLSIDKDVAIVSVVLMPGTYASVLLEELFGDDLAEADRADQSEHETD